LPIKRLKPKNDFIFSRLFGEQETKDSLISLLNAILGLEGQKRIADVTVIENKQLEKVLIDDKTGRLDVRAETLDRIQFDIELQVANQYNMTRRTLFYWAKLYVESIKAGGKYSDLKKTVTINILDFELLDISRFHSIYHLYEDHEDDYMLTDAMEIHFIEYPKFRRAEKNVQDPLHRWLLFLDDKLPEEQLEELIAMDPVIRKAEERLEWLSGDEATLRLYEAREFSRIERNSLVGEAEERGMEKGMEKGRQEGMETTAVNMLREGMDIALIIKVTDLPATKIEALKKQI
jgi:predicted transposase/invertase (TIGR01784 family)